MPGRAAVVGRTPLPRAERMGVTNPAGSRSSPPPSQIRIMPTAEKKATRTFVVLVNDEQQYSIWPADRAVPLGWTAVGTPGPRDQCFAHIQRVWSNVTPLGPRRRPASAPA